jgi:hypothetical protein
MQLPSGWWRENDCSIAQLNEKDLQNVKDLLDNLSENKFIIRLYFQHLNPKVDSNIKNKFPNFESI